MKSETELLAAMSERQDRCQAMLDLAASENRDFLSESEQIELDKLLGEIRMLSAQCEVAKLSASRGRQTPPQAPRTTSTETVRPSAPRMIDPNTGAVLMSYAPGQRMARPEEIDPEFSLARMVCAAYRGDWSDAMHEHGVVMQQTAGVGADGGFLVPAPLSAEVIDLAREQTRVIQAGARTIPMTSSSLAVARVKTDPTTNWRGELGEILQSEAQFERVNLYAKTLGCMVVSSEELLQDAPNADMLLRQLIAEAIAAELDRVALVGSGVGEPLGLLNTPGLQEEASVGTPTNYDDFMLGIESLWAANGKPDAVIYSPRTAGTLSRLKTGITDDETTLVPPQEFRDLKRFTSTRIPDNLGAGAESVAFIGGFSELVFGMRLPLSIAITNTGKITNPAGSGDAFSDYAIRIRAVVRVDVVTFRPSLLCKLTGITAT